MGRCRDHCPSGHGRLPWLFDLLLTLLLVGGGGWAAGEVAPVLDAALSSTFGALGWFAAAVAVAVAVRTAVVAVLNRRTLARYAELEAEAWAARRSEPAALTASSARRLDTAPSVRAEAFVERYREVA